MAQDLRQDPEGRTFLYIMYVEKVILAPEQDELSSQPMVCRWYIDQDNTCSQPLNLVSGDSVRTNYVSFLVISCDTAGNRSRTVTLTISPADGGEHLCCAWFDLNTLSLEENFKIDEIPLENSLGAVATVELHSASQQRWLQGEDIVRHEHAYFVDPTVDPQARYLYGHLFSDQEEAQADVVDDDAARMEAQRAEEEAQRAAVDAQRAEEDKKRKEEEKAEEERKRRDREREEAERREREAEESKRKKDEDDRRDRERKEAEEAEREASLARRRREEEEDAEKEREKERRWRREEEEDEERRRAAARDGGRSDRDRDSGRYDRDRDVGRYDRDRDVGRSDHDRDVGRSDRDVGRYDGDRDREYDSGRSGRDPRDRDGDRDYRHASDRDRIPGRDRDRDKEQQGGLSWDRVYRELDRDRDRDVRDHDRERDMYSRDGRGGSFDRDRDREWEIRKRRYEAEDQERRRREEDDRREMQRIRERRQWDEDRERLRQDAKRERQRETSERERRAQERRRQHDAATAATARLAGESQRNTAVNSSSTASQGQRTPTSNNGDAASFGTAVQNKVYTRNLGSGAHAVGSTARPTGRRRRDEGDEDLLYQSPVPTPISARRSSDGSLASAGHGAQRQQNMANATSRRGPAPKKSVESESEGSDANPFEDEFEPQATRNNMGSRRQQGIGKPPTGGIHQPGARAPGGNPRDRRAPIGSTTVAAAATQVPMTVRLEQLKAMSSGQRAGLFTADGSPDYEAEAVNEEAVDAKAEGSVNGPLALTDHGAQDMSHLTPRGVSTHEGGSKPSAARFSTRRSPRVSPRTHVPTADASAQTGLGGASKAAAEVVAAALADAGTGHFGAAGPGSSLGVAPVAAVEECVLRLMVLQKELGVNVTDDVNRSDLADAAAGLAPRMLQVLEAARNVCEANQTKLRNFCRERDIDLNTMAGGGNGYLESQLAAIDRLRNQYASLIPKTSSGSAAPNGMQNGRLSGQRCEGFALGGMVSSRPMNMQDVGFSEFSTPRVHRDLSIGASPRHPVGVSPRLHGGGGMEGMDYTAMEPQGLARQAVSALDPGGCGPQLPILRSGGSTPPQAKFRQPIGAATAVWGPGGEQRNEVLSARGDGSCHQRDMWNAVTSTLPEHSPGSTSGRAGRPPAITGMAAARSPQGDVSQGMWNNVAAAVVPEKPFPNGSLQPQGHQIRGGPRAAGNNADGMWNAVAGMANMATSISPDSTSSNGAGGIAGPASAQSSPRTRGIGPLGTSPLRPGTSSFGQVVPLRAALQQFRGVAETISPAAAQRAASARRPTSSSARNARGGSGGGAHAGAGSPSPDGRRPSTAMPQSWVSPRTAAPAEDKYLKILQNLQAKGAAGSLLEGVNGASAGGGGGLRNRPLWRKTRDSDSDSPSDRSDRRSGRRPLSTDRGPPNRAW